MKISKERLFEIIKEECEMGYQMTPDGEIDREGRMAKRQLSDIAKYSEELSNMLQDETQLEAWVQAKLTKAADYIKTVKHYVEYGMEEGAYDQVIPQMNDNITAVVGMAPQMGTSAPMGAQIGEFPLEKTDSEEETEEVYEF
jgi:O-methyltransferase involved in polyketide biosynthesis